jgi:ectoine hydroxylase-related dioxygenase (phytanoyl-CoA dioxygenase family)
MNLKKQLKENGFVVIKSLLNFDESEFYRNKINEIYKNSNIKAVEMGLQGYKDFWKLITNKNLLNVLRELFDNEFFFTYQAGILQTTNHSEYLHHRDNPCRTFGVGPDWDVKKVPYNIVRVGIYLQEFKNTNFSLNLIPKSNRKYYTFRNFLRFLHRKTRYIKKLSKIRNVLPKFFGADINTEPGDCIIFDPRLYHSPSPHINTRSAIFLSYGEKNIHTDNYTYYFTKIRSGTEFDKMGSDFLDFLRKNNLYYHVPEKIDILGAWTKEK